MGQDQLMPSFIELRKMSLKEIAGQEEYRLAVLGNVSTQHLSVAIQGYGIRENIRLNVYDADYDQIDLQLYDEESEVLRFQPDAFFLFIAAERLYEQFTGMDTGEDFAGEIFARICGWWERIREISGKIILQNTIMEMDDAVYGSFGSKLSKSFIFQLRKLNYQIMCEAEKRKDVFLVDFLGIQTRYGRNLLFDSKVYYMGKLIVSTEYLPVMAKAVTDIVKSILGRNRKCIVLDLDNTLWGGIVSEIGVRGIEIGELGKGHAFTEFQIWLKELKKRGILLAVCSKNEEEIAKEPFLEHPEMILKLEDFVLFVANWNDKAGNIKIIQETLNIGLDSMVFIDDNPFERELVKAMLPEVIVPELPEDPSRYLMYLRKLNLFETTSYSQEDADRTRQYQIEEKRKTLRNSFESYSDYLVSLKMVGEIKYFDEFHIPRIAQLTNRSNQFNLRTVRYSEKEIADIIEDQERIGLYVTLKDRFGDYGLISVIILQRMTPNTLFLDTWLMSCRVLKRGVENFILNRLVEIAEEKGAKELLGEYIETTKNAMVKGLYKNLGFEERSDGLWRLRLKDYNMLINYIEEKR